MLMHFIRFFDGVKKALVSTLNGDVPSEVHDRSMSLVDFAFSQKDEGMNVVSNCPPNQLACLFVFFLADGLLAVLEVLRGS